MFRTSLATIVILVATAVPASASPHTLNIDTAATTTFNTPTLFYVYGTDAPPSDIGGDFWLTVVVLPGDVVPACPVGYQDALGFAHNLPGQLLDIALQPDREASGDFSNPIIFRPLIQGRNLICAYSQDGAGITLARAGAWLDVGAPAADPPPPPQQPQQPTGGGNPSGNVPPVVHDPGKVAKPTNTARPTLTKSGRRATCGKGTWDGALSLAFAWQVDGRKLRGATTRTLRVARYRGHHIRCAVTGSNAGGATTALSRTLKV